MDARHLLAGRGVARYTRALLHALGESFGDDEWLAFVPGRTPVAAVHERVTLVRHRFGGRALHGAGAVAGRPRLDRLIGGGVDVAWAPAPAPLALSASVPLVLTVHDRSFEVRPKDFTAYERLWHRLARPRAQAARAAAVVVDSETVRAELAGAWGVASVVVRPGVTRGPAPARADGRYLLFVGSLEPRKAPDVLGRAYARARRDGLDADLLVVGEGRRRLEGPGIRRLGRVDDARLAALYAGALAVVAPSWLEGFGLTPVEAAAHGTPAVVSDLPIFAETLGDGALRVAPGDEAALAAALVRIAADPRLRAALGTRAADAVAGLSWESAAAGLHAVLRAVAVR